MGRAKRRSTVNPQELAVIEAGYRLSARERFALALPRVLASRPVLEQRVVVDRRSRTTTTEPVYGAPTFRNSFNEKGEWV